MGMVLLTSMMLSLFTTMVLIPIFKHQAVRLQAIDFPSTRSIHTDPKPRIGGIAMACGMLTPVLIWTPSDPFVTAVILGAGLIVLVGFIDDQRDLSYKLKFAGQLAAASLVIFYGDLAIRSTGNLLPTGMQIPEWLALPLTLFVIVGVTNAINLSDGLDGLAGGIALLCFSCIAIVAYQSGQYAIALIAATVIGAIFAFLRFNTYPAVIFMGDAGSLLLGFLAVTLSLGLSQSSETISPLFPLLLLGFPILDTLRVIVERISEGRSPFHADRNHFHHKLIALGFLHTEAVVIIYLLQAFLVAFAYMGRFRSEWFLIFSYLLFSAAVLASLAIIRRTAWRSGRPMRITQLVAAQLQRIKEKCVLIKISYWTVWILLPALLHLTCLLPKQVSGLFASLALTAAGGLFVIMVYEPRWLEKLLRVVLYGLIPGLVYACQRSTVAWLDPNFERIYNLTFIVLVAFVLCMLKFTRRQNGFKTTPTDFLILFIALIVPNLPDAQIQSYQMGLFAAKLIALLFSFEVLIGELRGELNGLSLNVIAALLLIAGRGVL
jgi:UDP-GlcNAc:undecaprenyl-phosphate GlcNAc-1-phosphate transferase